MADVWNQPIPPHMSGTGQTAFSHAAEVHYALPEGDEWSFNAWSPRVIGNDAYVPLCHYSGPKAIQKKVIEHGLGSDRRRHRATGCSSGSEQRSGSVGASPATGASRRSSKKSSAGPERRPHDRGRNPTWDRWRARTSS